MGTDKKFTIVGIGEVLWDILPSGKKLGGAPANFTFHSKSLGNDGVIVSAVGKDELGKEIIDNLEKVNLTGKYIQQRENKPTGIVNVELDKEGLPKYKIEENAAWDFMENTIDIGELASRCDAVSFGSLAQRSTTSRESIQNFLRSTSDKCIKVFDINLRQGFYNKKIIEESLELCNCLKLNESELKIISKLFDYKDDEYEFIQKLRHEYKLKYIAQTNGGGGSFICSENDTTFMKPEGIKIADTVGAGDAFTAGMVYGILNDMSLSMIHKLACRLASFVCTMNGAMPQLSEERKSIILKQ